MLNLLFVADVGDISLDFFTVLMTAAASLKCFLAASQNSLINQPYSSVMNFVLSCSF